MHRAPGTAALPGLAPTPRARLLEWAEPLLLPQDPSGGPAKRSPRLKVWRLDVSAAVTEAERAVLSDGEAARGLRFASAVHRRRHEAAHAALRLLLAGEIGSAPAALRFQAGWCGKPALEPIGSSRPPGSFNLSHSDDIGLLLWDPGGGDWGVDVERVRPIDDREAIAERVFTAGERQQLSARISRGEDADRLFLRLWTRKEACLKALGTGFSVEPGGFHAGLALPGQPQEVRMDMPRNVWPVVGRNAALVLLDLDAGADVVAAAALWLRDTGLKKPTPEP